MFVLIVVTPVSTNTVKRVRRWEEGRPRPNTGFLNAYLMSCLAKSSSKDEQYFGVRYKKPNFLRQFASSSVRSVRVSEAPA